MIARNGSYFDADLALQGHYVITGNTNDNFCSDLLQMGDIREALHSYLLEQNFDAVFFFDYTNRLYCYDQRSYRILTGREDETPQEQPVRRSTAIVESGPLGANHRAYRSARQRRNPPQTPRQPEDDRLHLSHMSMTAAWQQVLTLLRGERRRCALILSNINAMQGTFSESVLQVLQELTAGSNARSNVVIYVFRGNTMLEMLDEQTQFGSNTWNVFFRSVLRPLMETDTPEENRVISLRTPNLAEVRNLLNYIRFNGSIPLQVEPTQIDRLADMLSYGCARENLSLKRLRARLEGYAQEHPGARLTCENACAIAELPRHSTALDDLNRLIGLKDVKEELRKHVSSMTVQDDRPAADRSSSRFTPPPQQRRVRGHLLNVCLKGSAGTGKTEIAQLLGRMYYEAGLLPQGHTVRATASTLVSQNIGGTASLVRQRVQEAMGGVLFIDEAYALIKNAHGREAIDQLVNDMTTYEGQFAVVIAGYPRPIERLLQSNEGLASRFGTTFTLPDYTPDEMRRILELFVSNDPDGVVLSEELQSQIKVFCDNWATDHDHNWGNAREAAKLESLMKRNALDRLHHSGETRQAGTPIELLPMDIPPHLQHHLKPKAQSLEEVLKEINDMIGLHSVKTFLKSLADGQLWDDLQSPPGRFIFHGPPGTGKTHVARLMGTLLRRLGVLKRDYVYEIGAQDLFNPDPSIDYGTEHPTQQEILRAAVDNARGGIFFIDEAHQLNDSDEGHALIRALVPIIENPEIRADTCFILAGYSAPMRELLRQDDGLSRRFPEAGRIRFDSYTASELTRILKNMAEAQGQIPTEEYLARSRAGLSRFLENPPANYGDAGYIRDTFLPGSIRARLARLNEKYAGSRDALVNREVARNVDSAEKRTLTEADLPPKFQELAGPLGLPVPPEKTAWQRIGELVGKTEIKEYLEVRRNPSTGPMFYDNHAERGLHFALVGPTGSGRHTVARTMASLWKELGLLERDNVRFVSKGDLEAGFVGQTALKTAEVVEQSLGGCLVVENPSAMLPRSGTDNTFGPEALGVIAGAMSDPMKQISIMLIDTEEGMEQVTRQFPTLVGHLARVFHLEDLSPDEMQQLMDIKSRESLAFDPEMEELLPEFFLNWVSKRGGLGEASGSWGNGNEVDRLIDELIAHWKDQNGSTDDRAGYLRRLVTRQMFPNHLQPFLTRSRADKDTALKELMDLTGLRRVKRTIQSLDRESRMFRDKTPVPGVYAFIGHPGTGKTTVARLMGGVLRATNSLTQGHVIERTAQQLVERPEEFHSALKLAKNGILFIDEAPQLVHSGGGQLVLRQLLTVLEDSKVTSCTCIILAGYPREMAQLIGFDQGLSSRFGNEDAKLIFDNYTPEELVLIMHDMARKAHKISQIRSHAPLILDEEFVSLSRELFNRVIASGDVNFGNARYVRNYLRDCYKLLLERMDREHPDGAYPEDELRTLTIADIPAGIRQSLEKREQPALVSATALWQKAQPAITQDNYASRVEFYMRRTVLLDVVKEDGTGVGTGSIITSEGHVLTAAHVVDHAKKVRAKLYCPGMIGGDYRWFDCEILQPINTICDMALLKMNGSNFPVMPMRGPNESVGITEQTLLVGYPLGGLLNSNRLDELNPTHFAGRIGSSQLKKRGGRDVLHYYLDGRALHGDSGAPVISQTDGRLIGVFSGSLAPNTEGNLDELNLFFPHPYFWHNFVTGTTEEE